MGSVAIVAVAHLLGYGVLGALLAHTVLMTVGLKVALGRVQLMLSRVVMGVPLVLWTSLCADIVVRLDTGRITVLYGVVVKWPAPAVAL